MSENDRPPMDYQKARLCLGLIFSVSSFLTSIFNIFGLGFFHKDNIRDDSGTLDLYNLSIYSVGALICLYPIMAPTYMQFRMRDHRLFVLLLAYILHGATSGSGFSFIVSPEENLLGYLAISLLFAVILGTIVYLWALKREVWCEQDVEMSKNGATAEGDVPR